MKALLIWLLVAAPLAWGVTKSLQKSMPLFQGDSAPSTSGTKK